MSSLERRNGQNPQQEIPGFKPQAVGRVEGKFQPTIPVPGDYYLDPKTGKFRSDILEKMERIRKGQY